MAMVVAGGAQAQTTACDMLKSSLAARIEATGVHDYELEAVPIGEPTPPDARVIGNCSTGTYKVLYRRASGSQEGGAQRPPPPPARAARPAAEPPPATAQDMRTRGRRGPAAVALAAAVAPPATPSLAPQPVASPTEAASAAPLPARDEQPQAQAQAQQEPPVPERPAGQQAPAAQPEPPKVVSSFFEAAAVPPPASEPQASPRWTFVLTASKWLGALVLLLLAGAVAAWLVHRSAYDAAGLPRGPKVRSI
jgi:hypothetical protein